MEFNRSINRANAIPAVRCTCGSSGSCFATLCGDGLLSVTRKREVGPAALPDEFLAFAADKFRMLGDESRLHILRCLMEVSEANVSEIVARTGRQLANVSKHLKLLADNGLLSRRQQGAFVFYKLDDSVLRKVYALVCDSVRRDLEAAVKQKAHILQTQR